MRIVHVERAFNMDVLSWKHDLVEVGYAHTFDDHKPLQPHHKDTIWQNAFSSLPMARLCLKPGRKVPDTSKLSKSARLNQSILMLNRTQYAHGFT